MNAVIAGLIALALVAGVALASVAIGEYIDRNLPAAADDDRVIVLDRANLLDGVEAYMLKAEQHLPAWPRWLDDDVRERHAETIRDRYQEVQAADYDDDMIAYTDNMLRLIQAAHGALLATLGPRATRAAAAEVTRHDLALPDGTDLPEPQLEAVLRAHGWRPETKDTTTA